MFAITTILGVSVLLALLYGIILLAIIGFEVWMFVHAIQNDQISSNTRLLWIIGMLLVHPIVAIVYYCTDRNKAR